MTIGKSKKIGIGHFTNEKIQTGYNNGYKK